MGFKSLGFGSVPTVKAAGMTFMDNEQSKQITDIVSLGSMLFPYHVPTHFRARDLHGMKERMYSHEIMHMTLHDLAQP